MIYKATKENINPIIELGKLVIDNFAKTYPINEYLLNENYILLINEDKEINGFMLVYKNIDYYELEVIVVSEKYRNLGIATKLMEYFISNYCKKNDNIILEVSNKNEKAIKLYNKFGFETISIRKKYYKDSDAYIMKKVIN